MTEEEYFSHPSVSNSRLKSFEETLYPSSFTVYSEDALRFGKLYDARCTKSFAEYSQLLRDIGKPGEADILESMYRVLCQHEYAFQVLMTAQKQVPLFADITFTYNGIAFTLPCKCLYDFYLFAFGGDLKTFAGKTERQFRSSVKRFDWLASRVFYMLISKSKKDFIVGQGKEKPYPVFTLFIHKGDALWDEGLEIIARRAYNYYLLRF